LPKDQNGNCLACLHETEGADPVVEAGPPPVEAGPPPVEAGLAKNQLSIRIRS